jgi:hypothetical protein
MWGYAQEAAAAAGLQQQQLRLVEGDAQQMPFVSSSFDAAVMTLVSEGWTVRRWLCHANGRYNFMSACGATVP